MKFKALGCQAVLAALLAIGASGAAFAQADCKALIRSSPFGPEDQTGATNRITAAVTKAAGTEIQTGEVIPLWNVLVDTVPLYGSTLEKTILRCHGTGAGGRSRLEQADLHGGHLSHPEPCGNSSRRNGPYRDIGLLLQPNADG